MKLKETESNVFVPAKVSFGEEKEMDPGLGSGVGGCGKGGEGFTGGRKGARLRDSELEFLRHGIHR